MEFFKQERISLIIFFIKILRFTTRKLSLYACKYIWLLYNIWWCVVRLSRDFWWISLPRGLLLFSPPPLPLCVFPFFEMQGGGKRMVGHWPHSCRIQSQRKALIKSAKRPRANFSIWIVCFCGKYGLCVDGQAIKKARQFCKKNYFKLRVYFSYPWTGSTHSPAPAFSVFRSGMGETEGRTSIHFSRTAIALERQRIQLTIHWMELQFSRVSTGGASSCLHRLKKHFRSVLQNESISLLSSGVCHDSGNYLGFFLTTKKRHFQLSSSSLSHVLLATDSPLSLFHFSRGARGWKKKRGEEEERSGKKTEGGDVSKMQNACLLYFSSLVQYAATTRFFLSILSAFSGKTKIGFLVLSSTGITGEQCLHRIHHIHVGQGRIFRTQNVWSCFTSIGESLSISNGPHLYRPWDTVLFLFPPFLASSLFHCKLLLWLVT